MSPPPKAPASPPARQMSRLAIVLTGVALGAVWGTVMWGIFELAGQRERSRGAGPT